MTRAFDRDDWLHWRRRVHEIVEIGSVEDHASRMFDRCIIALILTNVAAFCLETVPSIAARWGGWLDAFEVVSVLIFTIEYVLRLWTAIEVPYLRDHGAFGARWRAALHPFLVIDLLAILPFYLSFMLGLDLRVLRVLRLLRFFKLSRYSPAMDMLLRVLVREQHSLMAAGLLLLAALLLASTGMYYIEGHLQPDKLGSVPDAAYWAMTTLTTVGYGDVSPITPLGKLWSMLTMLVGLCTLALPVAIIATGFAQEAGRRDFVVTWSLMSRVPVLAALDASDVSALLPMLHAHSLPPNAEIILDGSMAEAIYFVASGRVVRRHGESEDVYEMGDCIGVAALLSGDVHRGTYVSASKCRVLKLFRADLIRLEARFPRLSGELRILASTGSRGQQRHHGG